MAPFKKNKTKQNKKQKLAVKLNYCVTFHFLTFEMALSFERFIFLSSDLYMCIRDNTTHTLVMLPAVVTQSLDVCKTLNIR